MSFHQSECSMSSVGRRPLELQSAGFSSVGTCLAINSSRTGAILFHMSIPSSQLSTTELSIQA